MAFVVDRLAASQRTRMDQPGLYQIPECRKRVNLRYERFVPTGPLNPNLLALQTSSGGDLPTTNSCTAANNLSNSITSSARARSDCAASLCYPIVARGPHCRAATWRIRSAVASGAVSGSM